MLFLKLMLNSLDSGYNMQQLISDGLPLNVWQFAAKPLAIIQQTITGNEATENDIYPDGERKTTVM